MDPDVGAAYCFPTAGGEIELQIKDMKGYTCFSPDDTQTLIEWIRRRSIRQGREPKP